MPPDGPVGKRKSSSSIIYLGVGIPIGLLGETFAIAAAGGVLHAFYKNRQIQITREIDAIDRRVEQCRLDIRTTDIEKPVKLLSGGIAVALVTTELGLAVAIPAILAGALLNAWAERIKDGMEGAALRVINLFQDVRGAPAVRAAAAA